MDGAAEINRVLLAYTEMEPDLSSGKKLRQYVTIEDTRT